MRKLLLVLMFVVACSSNPSVEGPQPTRQLRVCIENPSWHRLDVRVAQGMHDQRFGPVESGRTECRSLTASADGVRVAIRQFASEKQIVMGPFDVPVGSTLTLTVQNHLPFTGVGLRHPR